MKAERVSLRRVFIGSPPKRLSICACLLVAALIAGCVNLPTGTEKVSSRLEQRTGHRPVASAPGVFTAPAGVSFADGLTEDEAVSVALCNNALFLDTLADLGIARADVVQAGMLPNPTLLLFFPSGSKQLEFTARLASEVIWQRPFRLRAARFDYERTADALVQNGLNLIRDVKLAYSDLVLAEDRQRLARQAADLSTKVESFAQSRVNVGEASELEVSTSRTDVLQGNEILGRSEVDVTIARERLRALLGLGLDRRPIMVKPPSKPGGIASADELVKVGLAFRPDLRAAELTVEAAGARMGLAIADIFLITAILDGNRVQTSNGNGSGQRQRIETGPGFDAALPILNQNQGGRARAKAQYDKAARQYVTTRDRIVLEVREAQLRYRQAQQSLDTWRTRILPPLEQAVSQAETAYNSGEANLLLVLDNTRRLTTARGSEAAALADLRRAKAELERAVGGRIPVK